MFYMTKTNGGDAFAVCPIKTVFSPDFNYCRVNVAVVVQSPSSGDYCAPPPSLLFTRRVLQTLKITLHQRKEHRVTLKFRIS